MTLHIPILFLCLSAAAIAADTAEAVASKAIEAMGGLDRIHNLRSLAFQGHHTEHGHTGNSRMFRMRPNLRLVGCLPAVCGNWGRIVEGFDGERGWEMDYPHQRLIYANNKAEQALKCGGQFDPLFVEFKKRGFRAEALGEVEVLEQKLIALRVDPRNGCQVETFYFDPRTYLAKYSSLELAIHARGELVDTFVAKEDYRSVAGVQMPFTDRALSAKTGEVWETTSWDTIEPNTISSAVVFRAPETHPGPATALAIRLRSDAASLTPELFTKSYEHFRAAPDNQKIDTEDDLTWLGYEFLKVDNHELALSAFLEVIHEHPVSSNSWDSLGDAYVQMKKVAEAEEAFNKALEADPKNRGSAEKLASLRAGKLGR